jgi:hypothetical protein
MRSIPKTVLLTDGGAPRTPACVVILGQGYVMGMAAHGKLKRAGISGTSRFVATSQQLGANVKRCGVSRATKN